MPTVAKGDSIGMVDETESFQNFVFGLLGDLIWTLRLA
jgi:hypothetical protein